MFWKKKHQPATRILLVEDEPAVLASLKDRLEMNDFIVLTASNGGEGLSTALGERPDIIITDLMMPIMGGLEMIEALRKSETGKCIPIMILSARRDQKDMELAAALGVVDYLIKPFEMSELLGKINDVIENCYSSQGL
ncbi:MAG: hypothetical protein A2Y07_06780 [Planctomycetes bacterium GWF2_50_10]|nr:MAG: hypothetical protein A2Y07_06780 [Planctomycetes bacterium GWF2_50_10]